MMFSTWSRASRLPCSQMSRMTSCGRRSSMARSASSKSAPCACGGRSWRKPATISRISASSSTIRMSERTSLAPWHCELRFSRTLAFPRDLRAASGSGPLLRSRRRLGRMRPPDWVRTSAPCVRPGAWRRVLEGEHARVLLDALLHDREPEAGALGALGGDIRLGEADAVPRQADTVVDDLEVRPGRISAQVGLDTAAPAGLARLRRRRIRSIPGRSSPD